jgi:hypothetical protein
MEEIEKLFHHEPPSPGLAIPVVDEISDVHRVSDLLLKRLHWEVQEIVDRKMISLHQIR